MKLEPDLEMACHQLELINPGGEGCAGVFHFTLIPDQDPRRRVRQIQSTFGDALPRLIAAQHYGYGVFVIPQETQGSKLRDIRRVRSIVLDFDSHESLETFLEAPLLPVALVVSTARGGHVYFECDPDDDCWLLPDSVRRLPGVLAQTMGADAGAAGLAQPFRLAGFYHLKGDPLMMTIRSLNFGSALLFRLFPDCSPPLPEVGALPPARGEGPYPFPVLRYVLRECCRDVRQVGQENASSRFAGARIG